MPDSFIYLQRLLLPVLLRAVLCTGFGAAYPLVAWAGPADLHDALAAALSRPSAWPTSEDTMTGAPTAGGWLAGLPSLSVSHLVSDADLGTDETEISLSFPIKSPLRRDSDKQLAGLETQLDDVALRYRAWLLSGVLRDLGHGHQLATLQLDTAREKVRLLEVLASALRRQQAAGSANRFESLTVAGSLRGARAELARLERLRADSVGRFRALTGAAAIPGSVDERVPLPGSPGYASHPALAMLDLDRRRWRASLSATSPSATPWSVALVGRQLDQPALREQQLGLALQIPLPVGARPTTSIRSDVRALERSFLLQRDEMRADIQRRWQQLQAEREGILARLAALEPGEGPVVTPELVARIAASRELPVELRVQRLLLLLDLQLEPELVRAQLAANGAALRQLAGIPL